MSTGPLKQLLSFKGPQAYGDWMKDLASHAGYTSVAEMIDDGLVLVARKHKFAVKPPARLPIVRRAKKNPDSQQ